MPRAKQFDEEEVVEKAMTLFWRKGYRNTSLTDLIEYIGINNASIYNTFGGKKELFDRTIEHYRKQNYEGMSNFLASQHDIRLGLRSVFRKIIMDDWKDEDKKGCFIANTISELLPHDPKLMGIIQSYRKDVVKTFQSFLERGVKDGQIPPNKDLYNISNL